MTTEEFEKMLKDRHDLYLKLALACRRDREQRNIYTAIANTYEVVLAEYQGVMPPARSLSEFLNH